MLEEFLELKDPYFNPDVFLAGLNNAAQAEAVGALTRLVHFTQSQAVLKQALVEQHDVQGQIARAEEARSQFVGDEKRTLAALDDANQKHRALTAAIQSGKLHNVITDVEEEQLVEAQQRIDALEISLRGCKTGYANASAGLPRLYRHQKSLNQVIDALQGLERPDARLLSDALRQILT